MGVKEILSQLTGLAAHGVQTGDPLATSVLRWCARIQEHVFGRWRHIASLKMPCAVRAKGAPPCPHPAIAGCMLCGSFTCLEHASIAAGGEVCCLGCLSMYQEVVRARVGAPKGAPDPGRTAEALAEARKRHTAALGVPFDASWTEINSAFKKASRKLHPDVTRGLSAPKRAAAEAKYKMLTQAHQWLSENTPREKAA